MYNKFVSLYNEVSHYIFIDGKTYHNRVFNHHYKDCQYKKLIKIIEWIRTNLPPQHSYHIRYVCNQPIVEEYDGDKLLHTHDYLSTK